MFNFVLVQGQFRRIAELDSRQAARKGEGMDAPSQHEDFNHRHTLSIPRIELKLHFVQNVEPVENPAYRGHRNQLKGDVFQRFHFKEKEPLGFGY